MNACTPVVTDWRESSALGEPWTYLATYVEDLATDQRAELARAQMEAYIASIPSRRDATVDLYGALDLYARKG
jgi:hypothetical protein